MSKDWKVKPWASVESVSRVERIHIIQCQYLHNMNQFLKTISEGTPEYEKCWGITTNEDKITSVG